MKPGALLQLLSLEMDLGCNLGHLHTRCPNSLGSDRYEALSRDQRLSDPVILNLVQTFYADQEFRGWVGFSFYNEPLLHLPRLLALVEAIRALAPDLKFMLTTNGTKLPEDPSPLRVFSWIGVTDYGGEQSPDPQRLEALRAVVGHPRKRPEPHGLFVNKGRLDVRMARLGPDRSAQPCRSPFQDFAIDHYGNAHLCCFDWRGRATLGNVLTDGVDAVMARWEQTVRQISGTRMTDEAPASCRCCRFRRFHELPRLNRAAHKRAKRWLEAG